MTQQQTSHPAPAGWYDDPAAGDQRYWDGSNWTDQRRVAPPPPPPAPPKSNRRRWLWAGGAAALVLLIAAGILVASLVQNTARSSKASHTFTVQGTLDLNDSSGYFGGSGESCEGSDGYADISTGTQVSIKNSAGKVVAVGSLGDGTSDTIGTCTFDFTVDDVPSDGNIYAVEVSHRGDINFTRSEASEVALTLGGN